jgi:ParB/RepB/Spo0J family partition protein
VTGATINRLADLMSAQTARSGLEIDLDKITADPDQPRRHWDDAGLRGLADSIAARGIVQPLVLRRDPDRPGCFIIVAGERRWRAARLAGLERLPAILKEVVGDERIALQLVENLDREDLHVLDEARAIQRLAEVHSLRGRDIARLLGKHESWVSQRRKLAQNADILEDVVEAGGTQDVETLTQLADLHRADRARFDVLVAGGRISRAQAKRALQQARAPAVVAPGGPPPAAGTHRRRTDTRQEPPTALAPPSAMQPGSPSDTAVSAGRSGAPAGLSDAALRRLAEATVRIDARGLLCIALPGGGGVEMELSAAQVETINRFSW